MDDVNITSSDRDPTNGIQEVKPPSYMDSMTSFNIQQMQGGKTSVGINLEPPDTPPTALMDKLRTHYRDGSTAGSKSKVFARVLFQFQGLTFFFMVNMYLSPYALDEYGGVIPFFLNVFFWYIFVMVQYNWLNSILQDSDLPVIQDLPPGPPELDELIPNKSEDTSGQTGATLLPRIDNNGLMWKFCQDCQRFRAPRAYHCKFCRKCILRRDHHCHLIGKCIGHYNQRFFVVLCFYTMLSSAIGFPITVSYLSTLPEATGWTQFIFPYTCILFVFRYVSLKFILLTFHAYMLFIFGILSLLYWLSQLSIISMGKTLVEVAKQMDMKVTSSLSENFAVVFGDYWFLSFILPMQTFFKQTHDGIHYRNVKIFGKKEEKV